MHGNPLEGGRADHGGERNGPGEVVAVDRHEVIALCTAALGAAGAAPRVAELLSEAALGWPASSTTSTPCTTGASTAGPSLDGPPSPAVMTSDTRAGIAQARFDEGFAGLVQAARRHGLASFAQRKSFTCWPLGWFTGHLADAGLVALATAAPPALVAAGPSGPGPGARYSPSTRHRAAPPSSPSATPPRGHRPP